MASKQHSSQTFQPNPPQYQAFAPQHPIHSNKVVSSKGWYSTKIVLGCASILIALAVIGVGAALVAKYPIDSAFRDMAYTYPPAAVSIVWQKAEFITLCVRRDRGIHPAAHVVMQSVIWGACAVLGGFLTAQVGSDASTSYWNGECCSESETIGYSLYLSLEESLAALLWLLMITHIVLFLRACIECHRRNTNQGVQSANP